MGWFKVDDGFAEHAKLDGLEGSLLMAAMTVWLFMGVDCSKRLTNGFVHRSRLNRVCFALGRRAKTGADALVKVGLWENAPEGYQFKNWDRYQPDAIEEKARRKASTARMQRFRAKRRDATGDASQATSRDAAGDKPVTILPIPIPRERERDLPPPPHDLDPSPRGRGPTNGGGGRGSEDPFGRAQNEIPGRELGVPSEPGPDERGFTQARMCAVFRREWWGARNAPANLHTKDPMTARRLHVDVLETADNRGEDPEALFVRVLQGWLPTAPDDSLTFPFAFFAARFGRMLATSPKQTQELAYAKDREDLARQLQLIRGGGRAQ